MSYNCANATELDAADKIANNGKLIIAAEEDADINKSDVSQWRWYTAEKTEAANGFGAMKLYAYDHEFKKVIGLAYDQTEDKIVSVVTDRAIATGTASGQTITDDLHILSLTVRRAGARVLTAEDINSMVDADGSWMNKADRADRDSVYFENQQGVVNDLFTNGYKAYENTSNGEKGVGRSATGKYQGYNIFFAKQYKDNNGVYNKYLKVAEDARYENIPATDLHRGLQVRDEFYGYWSSGAEQRQYIVNTNGSLKPKFKDEERDDAHENLLNATTIDALSARYLWKVTYYPTPDSLAIEPLNASIVGTHDYAEGNIWQATALPNAEIAQFYNTINEGMAAANATDASYNGVDKKELVPVALTVMNMGGPAIDKNDVLTVGTTLGFYGSTFEGKRIVGSYGKPVVTNFISEHGLKVEFDHTYTKMERATLADGLYFIQLQVDEANSDIYRKNGSNLVMNLAGRLMYDNEDDYQNYNRMPATQWVIEQDTCDFTEGSVPYVTITNREYGKAGGANDNKNGASINPVFHGQLYKAGEDTYYFINHSDEYQQDVKAGKFEPRTTGYYKFDCGDTLVIKKVEDDRAWTDAYLGYKKFEDEEIPYRTWAIKYNKADIYGGLNADKFLQINEDNFLAVGKEETQSFEVATGYTESNGTKITTVTEDKYGYNGRWNGSHTTLPQLKRQAYVMKVRDNNLIDNQWNYLVAKEDNRRNLYYQSSHLKNVDGKNVQLAAFYFKADQVTADEKNDAYVPVQILDMKSMKPTNADAWLGYCPDVTDAAEFKKLQEDYVSYHAAGLAMGENPNDELVGYNYRAYYENGFMQLGIKSQTTKSTMVSLDTDPETVNDAFVFTDDPRPLYMPISQDVTNGEMNTTVNMFRTRGINGGAEYLFEDGGNQSVAAPSALAIPSFLGITGEGIKPAGENSNTSFYVDSVISSNPRMPQYLFFVDNDSIKDGRWCKTSVHGYFPTEADADAEDATHHVFYNGYVSGRVLVNLNDSIFQSRADIDLETQAAKFGYRNYTRLGFVEGIHMVVKATEEEDVAFGFINEGKAGEYLLILKGGLKLEDLASKWEVLDPKLVKEAIEDKMIDVKTLDGKHKNYAFSLRYTDDEHQEVLLESAGAKFNGNKYVGEAGSIGTFKDASWMNVINGVPVLAQKYNFNGTHNEIGANTSMSQLINQAQIIRLSNGEEQATSNDEISATGISVVATNGAIIVKGAEGKNVVITNVLGQQVANTVVSSSEATIAAPAGVVVVAVEGEAAVKAIVK